MDKDLKWDGMKLKESVTAWSHLHHWFKITEKKGGYKILLCFWEEKKLICTARGKYYQGETKISVLGDGGTNRFFMAL